MKRSVLPVLAISRLRVTRGSTVIPRAVAWTVARGEHGVIPGPNSCGKTSLLRALTGCLSPSAGPIAAALSNRTLSKTFGAPVRLSHRDGVRRMNLPCNARHSLAR